jgi:hypothetical protein
MRTFTMVRRHIPHPVVYTMIATAHHAKNHPKSMRLISRSLQLMALTPLFPFLFPQLHC